MPDPQGNGQPSIAITGPSAMVQQMAAQRFALKNGGQMPPAMQGNGTGTPPPVATVNPNMGMNFFGGGNQAVGKYDAQPVQTGAAQPTDFTQMQQPQQFEPQNGYGNANPTVGPVATPYMKDASETTQQPQTNFEGMRPESGQGAQWNPNEQYSDVGYKGGPYDPSQYDSLSAALNGSGLKDDGSQTAQFQADPNQRDGGFFGWLKGLIPKKRPGKREGETDDEYDARRTRNMEMVATFADAIRHMGNIVNTAKGAPLQQFNDPTSMLEQGYQNRKAQRQKQAALDADAAYKQANLSLKERAAEADRAYKQAQIEMQQNKFNYQKGRDDVADKKWQAKFEFDAAKDDRDFKYKQIRDKVKDGQWQAGYGIKVANLNLSRARFAHTLAKDAKGGGTVGSGYAYATPYGSLYSKNQLSRNQENQMWDFMVRNGQITKQKLAEYNAALSNDETVVNGQIVKGSSSKARGIMQKAIAYGLMDATKRGDDFRKFCTTQLGMGEDRVYKTPQHPTTWKRGSVKKGKLGNVKV